MARPCELSKPQMKQSINPTILEHQYCIVSSCTVYVSVWRLSANAASHVGCSSLDLYTVCDHLKSPRRLDHRFVAEMSRRFVH